MQPRQQVQPIQQAQIRGVSGLHLAEYFHLDPAPALALVSPSGPRIVATRLRSAGALADRTASLPSERAFIIPVHLHPEVTGCYEVWVDGRYTRIDAWPVGGIGIYNLESNPIWRIAEAFDALYFHVPRSMLQQFAEENDLAKVDMLECAQGTVDAVLYQITQVLLPALTKPEIFGKLFLEHIRMMLCAHLVQRYGTRSAAPMRFCGGLAPWQKRRMTEMMQTQCEEELRLSRFAAECGLSISHFARSFKRSFGMTVHRYLLAQRVERAKALLERSNRSLAEVALESGFTDQSAFNRAFGTIAGTSPGRWRRERALCSPRGEGPYPGAAQQRELGWKVREGMGQERETGRPVELLA